MNTSQLKWKRLVRGTTNQADVNTPALVYGTTWATAGQNPANWPSYAQTIPLQISGVRMQFALSAAANKTALVGIWLRDAAGNPFCLGTVTVTSGTAACGVDPTDDVALTNFTYADTVVLTTGRSGWFDLYSDAANGIAEVRFDPAGAYSICATVDCDATGGTAAADCIVFWKGY